MITTLSFYDFDGTLMDTPLPDSGKETWLEKTGEEYPHIGWWSRAESLDPEVFDIKPFPSVLNQLNDDNAKADTYTVMLTSRMSKLQPQVEILLNKYDITFDDLSLKSGGGEKDERIKQYLQKFPDVTTINVYDDRDKEMKIFSKMKKEIGDKYQINIYRVNDGNFGLVENNFFIKNLINEEIKKIILESKENSKESLKRSKNIPNDIKEKIYKYMTSSSKYVTGGYVTGLLIPKELKSKTPKTDGLGFGADKDGFYLYTHRGRCKSYKNPESISVKDIEWVESTG